MGKRNQKRLAGIIAALAVGLGLFAFRAGAQPQPPDLFPVPTAGETLPPLTVDDPDVQPAQFTTPGSPPATATTVHTVPDPPSPVVRIQVRVPADSPPDDGIRYVITVQNASQAEAHSVTVRNPIPDTVQQILKHDPTPDPKLSDPNRQLVWSFGTLKPGEKKTIELTLKPKPDAKEVKNLAYVKFEHGEQVTTKINRPGVKVSKTAPKQTVRDEPYAVRVVVENTGKVPAENLRVVENVDPSAEVEVVTTGGKRTKPDDNQWQWEIGKLLPGQRKVIEYRVTPKQARDALSTTNVSADKGVLEKAEARTQVLVPGLGVKLTGPPGVVGPGQVAQYEIVVRNTGTLPATNVRVSGSLPADCKLTMKTNGGQVYRDQIVWTLPRLEPGEAQSFRFKLTASTTGRRVVTATAADARNQRDSQELATVFQGAAAIQWETIPDPVAVHVGKPGMFTVRVKNVGGEAARNVRLEVDLPKAIGVDRVTPNVAPAGGKIVFPAETIPAYGEMVYTISYTARESTQAWFGAKLTADALGDRPLKSEKMVEILGGGR